MKYKLKYLFILIILASLLLSCDLEKLEGSNYSYNLPPESAIFIGTIYNKFTLEPVNQAEINIANQVTYSDENGKYILYYHYGKDDQRNQPVDVKVSGTDYIDLDTSVVVFPENKLNAYIKYAAPIIQKIALVDTNYIQAIVFDYQGYNDIVTVKAQYAYRRAGEKFPSLYAETKLTRVFVDSLNTSYYESRIAPNIVEYGDLITDEYSVHAEDRMHFQDFMTSLEGGTDTLLFPTSTK